MSLVDQLKNLFSKKAPDSEQDLRLSIGEPDASVDLDNHEQTANLSDVRPLSPGEDSVSPEEVAPIEATAAVAATPTDQIQLPLLGSKTVAQHQRTLFILLGLALLILAIGFWYGLSQAKKSTLQLDATGTSLTQGQRLAKSTSQALGGGKQAFLEVADSASVLARSIRGLKDGDAALGIAALGGEFDHEMSDVMPMVERAEKSAATMMGQEKILTQVNAALKLINRQSSDLLEIAESVSSLKLQQNAGASEISAAGQLVMLTQRIGKSSNEFLTTEGVGAEAVFLLGKDLNAFKEIATGLLQGSSELKLSPVKDPQTKEQLEALIKLYDQTRGQAGIILGNLQGLVASREAQQIINTDSEPMRKVLEELRSELSNHSGLSGWLVFLLALAAALAALCAWGLTRLQLVDGRNRQALAEAQQHDAERQEQEAKRVNDANQAAILRLMNELQSVAEGDLTQEATVTEDITGAIADSVNYTIEELRSLVSQVQNTASRVAQTTTDVDSTSTELLAASTEQLREIGETGRSVVDMAARINDVSAQAQESATVARQSLVAAESGLQAVQNAIGGMNSIRDQIQDTSKRIKRLGESSQEIGEITELISDITEQTNVLALNAAIQAASAGEAGRGFSVVAEEVQRLAERSADATRQISALVKAIQTDTQDAVAAMERSTQGVVEGAKLSDNAGTALTEIDQVSRRLSELIQHISNSTAKEATLANVVAGNIQNIFAVTEQTSEGTKATATQVRELSRMADELNQSVSRFKIA
jgi:twitching motility protein PilJ